jgi:hypothetical protein
MRPVRRPIGDEPTTRGAHALEDLGDAPVGAVVGPDGTAKDLAGAGVAEVAGRAGSVRRYSCGFPPFATAGPTCSRCA